MADKLEERLNTATSDQMERANAAVGANMLEDGSPKYESAFGYACALTAILFDADEITRLNALVDEMREGLEPFALAPIGSGKEPPEPFPSDDTQVAFIANVTFGDFRKLRALITKASRDSGHG